MIALRLARAHAGLFAASAATAFVAGALATSVPGYLLGATTASTRTGIADLVGAEGAYRVSIRLPDGATAADAAEQDVAVRRVVARSTGGIPLEVTRTLATSDPLDIAVDGADRAAYLQSVPDLPRVARLVDGTWPTGKDETAVQADAAGRLGLAVGSGFRIGDRDVRVSALWRARDPLAPRWLGDRAVRTGRGDGGDGPIVVAPALWSRIGTTPLGRWTILPDARAVSPGDLDRLGRIDSVVPDAFQASRLGASGVETGGRLPDGVRAIALRVSAVLVTAPVSAIVLVALTLLALIELARLLLLSRARETLLLRSRGASTRRLAAASAVEAGVVSLASAAAGAVVAAVAAGATTGVPVPIALPVAASIGLGLVAAAVFGATTGRAARAALTREQIADSGRRRRLASTGILVLVGAAAVLSSAQFLRNGSPLVVDAGRTARIDPLAAPAPALAIVAVALVAVAVAPLVARAGTGLLDRGSRLTTLLARRLRRGLVAVASGIVLVALGSALLVTAAGYAATLDRASRENRAVRLGADVVASGAPVQRLRRSADAVRAPSTVVRVADALLGERSITLVAVPSRAISSTVTDDGALDRAALSRALAAPRPGIALPPGAGTVRASVSSTVVAPETVTLRMLTPDGVILSASAEPTGSGAVAIPVPRGASRLIGIDAVLPPAGSSDPGALPLLTSFELTGLRTDRGGLATGRWSAPFVSPDPPQPAIATGELGATVAVNPGVRTAVRLMPVANSPLPVVLARDLATASGLRVGSTATIDDDGAPVEVLVRGIIAGVPGGGGNAILVDLPALAAADVRGTDLRGVDPTSDLGLWLAGTAADAARLRAALPRESQVQSVFDPADRGAVSSAAAGLWIGTTGALLLAAIAVAAVVGADLRARDGDVAVLRALGVAPRRQGLDRVAEHAAVLGYGMIAGVAGGLVVSALLVPGLARAAVPDPIQGLPIGLRLDPLQLAIGIVALAAVLGALLAVAGSRVRARARAAVVSETTR